ncbi:cation diffusion facilitator family transporter [Balneolales bacterium ANBcel1]|nr:cation diffusion facilitator family transporter [Balneolales bacterium ANBcel1]
MSKKKTAPTSTEPAHNRTQRAITVSLVVSIIVFLIKLSAYLYTGANSVLSDAAESFIHVFAVGFSTFGIYLSQKPPDLDHPYGHERIGFFAVGAEGMLILVAALTICYQSVMSLFRGIQVFNLEAGAAIIFISAFINLVLGLYLVRTGKQENSMILIGNGKHTLTDVYTSGGVLVTLILISRTGLLFLDALVAMGIALYISLEGYRLVRYATTGLMDQTDPETDAKIRGILDGQAGDYISGWHDLRHRSTGSTLWIEFHLLFKPGVDLEKAHREATILEKKIMDQLGGHVIVTAHLEPEGEHARHHETLRDK